MRYLVTWTSPYIYRTDEIESIGVYGIEGRQVVPVFFWFILTGLPVNPVPLRWQYGALMRLSASEPKGTDKSSGRQFLVGSRRVNQFLE